MKTKELFTALALLSVMLFAGCKEDDYNGSVGVCPEVILTSPLDGAINVPFEKIISAKFNEKMDITTINSSSFTISVGETLIDGVVTYLDSTAYFTPNVALMPDTTYKGTIKATVRDPMGNYLQEDYVWTFKTDANPTVILTNPENLESGVALDKIITAKFSEPMSLLTMNNSTFVVRFGTTPISGTVIYSDSTASFIPSVPLELNTTYNCTITTGARNMTGSPLIENYNWSFLTSARISLTSNPELGGITTGSGIFSQGEIININAIPNVGYTFKNWTEGENVVSINPGFQFTMSGNRYLVANFSINNYLLTVLSNNGTVAKSPNLSVFDNGTIVTLTATPNAGFTFTSWSGDATSNSNPLMVTMNSDKTITANYTAIPPITYTLNVNANNGSVSKQPNQLNYNTGTTVLITATPNAGYTFTSWSGDASGSVNPLNVVMNSNKNVTANFTAILPDTYTLNVTANNGSVVKQPNQTNYNAGVSVILTATPNVGYTFTSWSGDASGSNNPLTVVMNSNKSITANFNQNAPSGPGAINLGSAIDFAVLTKAGISTTGVTSITGNIGVSPMTASGITGFGLIMDVSNEFSHTPIVSGKVFAADYSAPTPAKMTTAISDMEIAYTTANGLTTPAPVVALGAGNISGMTLAPGLYKWDTGLLISNSGVTLSGGANDTWVFQIAQDFTINNSAIIHLTGGAQAKNIFWVVAGKTTLGTDVNFSGIILCKTLISLNSRTYFTGRLFAQTAVTLNASTVIQP